MQHTEKTAQRLLEATAVTLFALLVAWRVSGPSVFQPFMMSLALTALGLPLFRRYALARPNARSSHAAPMPQGGGLTIIVAVILALLLPFLMGGYSWVIAGVVLLAVIGALDDILTLPVLPRLSGQLIAVAMAIHGAGGGGQIFPFLPQAAEFALLVVAGAWFVNLTNFIDGIDGITLAGFIPLSAGAVLLGQQGALSETGSMLAVFFLSGLIGFIVFNYPRATIFLGDVGSLPIGLIGGVLLLELAQRGAFAAAIMLPLYHFTDATWTLLLRLRRGEKVWEAHRQHAYQRAVDAGWSHKQVSGIVMMLNAGLVGVALLSFGKSAMVQAMLVALALAAVAAVILFFRSRKSA
jgi:UDP-N-acetylmuramyl pentapeptide phosphotransferase/UDP-N-acetylglucosamine-1-phosphate transferase